LQIFSSNAFRHPLLLKQVQPDDFSSIFTATIERNDFPTSPGSCSESNTPLHRFLRRAILEQSQVPFNSPVSESEAIPAAAYDNRHRRDRFPYSFGAIDIAVFPAFFGVLFLIGSTQAIGMELSDMRCSAGPAAPRHDPHRTRALRPSNPNSASPSPRPSPPAL
jgi:hypothetical protein